jgi:hypothetical protein
MVFSGIDVGAWWPLLPAAGALVISWIAWSRRSGELFPDIALLRNSAAAGGLVDRMPLQLGVLISVLLLLSLMELSATRLIEVDRRARDFLVVVDTSRSMRENTALLREQFPPTYERKANLYVGEAEDPAKIPNLARYEVARESLLHYLTSRSEVDRVGLIYFNSMIYLMSGFTSNFDFIEQQLAEMDGYVTFGTNMRWALEQALNLVERYPGRNRRAIILLTDAEARNTDYLQQQLDRLRRLDIAFYLLWITADTADGQFDDVSEGYLDEALDEIAELEDYAYREGSHKRVDLSRYTLLAAQWLMLLWILLAGTLWLPLTRLKLAGEGAPRD